MAYVPGFQYDYFISYGHEYNEGGAVSRFVSELSSLLRNHLGRRFQPDNAFFDRNQLGGATNVAWRRTVQAAANRSAILVPLLSPGYRDSSACREEFVWFRSGLSERRSSTQMNSPQICSVLWWKSDLAEFDAGIQAAQYHNFVSSSGQTFHPDSAEWRSAVDSFALRMAEALNKLRSSHGGIYVGFAPEPIQPLRQSMLDEIHHSGYRSVTAAEIPAAKLTVHFLGGQYLDHLADVERSLQLCPGETIVYIPPQSTLDAAERDFLHEAEEELQQGRRFAGRPYHRLENHSPTQLMDFIRGRISAVRSADNPPTVAIPCEKGDVEAALELAAKIEAFGLHAACPDFLLYETSIATRQEKFRDLFLRSEALLYYWAKADSRSIEGLRMRARASNRSFRGEAWYLAPPADRPGKSEIPTGHIIRQAGQQIDPEAVAALNSFLTSLRPVA